MKVKFLIASLIMCTSLLMGQIKSVSYQLDFNAATRLYDVSLIVNEGSAVKSIERIQFNAQIALITPTNAGLEVVKTYMPLIDNARYNGKDPLNWEVSNYLKNVSSLNGRSIYSISPKLVNTSYYNNLNEGDKIKLFSLEIYPLPLDKSSVRIYSNKTDASSVKLEGCDFRNGFTMGSVTQVYNELGNLSNQEVLTKDNSFLSSTVYPNPAVNNIHIDVRTPAEDVVNISIYNIEGKLVNKSTQTKDAGLTSISKQLDEFSPGIYTITVDALGQRQEHKVVVLNK